MVIREWDVGTAYYAGKQTKIYTSVTALAAITTLGVC